MIKQGYLKTTRVEKAKNPSIDYIEDFLNNRVAYLVLQVTQGVICDVNIVYIQEDMTQEHIQKKE